MSDTGNGSHAPEGVQLSYQLIRNITSPEEKANGVQTFVGNFLVDEVVKLDTTGNLRNYIAEYDPRRRNRVHEAISDTIDREPDRFINRHSGFTVTASDLQVDDKKKIVTMTKANLINGAQSQGEIDRFLDAVTNPDSGELETDLFHCRIEIIVDPDDNSVVETAIARNTTTPVKNITQAGARGHLDELEASVRAVHPKVKLKKSETDFDCFDTEKLLQWCRLLMPSSLSGSPSASEKLRAYKNKAQCLAEFSESYENKEMDQAAKARYEFVIQIAPYAISEYEVWEAHVAWNGHNMYEDTKKGRAIRRDKKTKKIVWVAPGILFPLIGAMSEFVLKDPTTGLWSIKKPSQFKSDEMVARAVRQFRAHESDPMMMGRSEASYDALRMYPETINEVLASMKVA